MTDCPKCGTEIEGGFVSGPDAAEAEPCGCIVNPEVLPSVNKGEYGPR